MKAVGIVFLFLLLLAAATAAYWLRPAPSPEPIRNPEAAIKESAVAQEALPPVAPSIRADEAAVQGAPGQKQVQPLEKRGDAMLFEIDALQNTPFDDAVTRPFD